MKDRNPERGTYQNSTGRDFYNPDFFTDLDGEPPTEGVRTSNSKRNRNLGCIFGGVALAGAGAATLYLSSTSQNPKPGEFRPTKIIDPTKTLEAVLVSTAIEASATPSETTIFNPTLAETIKPVSTRTPFPIETPLAPYLVRQLRDLATQQKQCEEYTGDSAVECSDRVYSVANTQTPSPTAIFLEQPTHEPTVIARAIETKQDLGIQSTPTPEGIGIDLVLSVKPAGGNRIPDSVIPTGIRLSATELVAGEAVMAAFVFNGDNSGNPNFDNDRLNEARTELVRQGLPPDFRIDIPNLRIVPTAPNQVIRIKDVSFGTLGLQKAEGANTKYIYEIYKANANVASWDQVAVDDGSGRGYPSHGTLTENELADVLIIYDLNGNLIYKGNVRDGCANPMGESIAEFPVLASSPVDTSTPYPTMVVSQTPNFTLTASWTPSATSTFRPGETRTATFTPTATNTERASSTPILTPSLTPTVIVPTNPHLPTEVASETVPPPTETRIPIPSNTPVPPTEVVPPTATLAPTTTPTEVIVPTNPHLPTEVASETVPPPTETRIPVGDAQIDLIKYFETRNSEMVLLERAIKEHHNEHLQVRNNGATLAANTPALIIGFLAISNIFKSIRKAIKK